MAVAGGAGGLLTSITTVTPGNYTVTVGAGDCRWCRSKFFIIGAASFGNGYWRRRRHCLAVAVLAASGAGAGVTGAGGAGIVGQGHNGGSGGSAGNGGGGGGAGSVGNNAVTIGIGGAGGAGLGSSYYW